MTPARFRWGCLLILIGVVLLLRNLDTLNDNFWADFLIYLPVLLIAIGIEKIFTKTKFQFISYITTILVFAGALYIAYSSGSGGRNSSFFEQTTYEWKDDSSVKELQATINLGTKYGKITVRDASDYLVEGDFKEFSQKPEIDKSVDGSIGKITFTGRGNRVIGGLFNINTDELSDWYLSFSKDIPLDLECFGKESDIHLNLSTTPTRKVVVDADQATIYLKLGNLLPNIQVDLKGKDSDLRLRVPIDVGLKISGIGDEYYFKQIGLTQRNNDFYSEGYDTLTNKISVDLDDRFSSVSIDFY